MSKYATAHANPQGPGDDRPTAAQIIEDEGVEGKLRGKVMVLTGVTSGIGIETARALSRTGATLFLTVRDRSKAENVLREILEPGRVVLVEMDNSSLSSVRAAASNILAQSNNQANILVCNAGILSSEELKLSEDGHEMTFATNHLSHFLLFQLLRPALLASSTPDFHSRVVLVASSAHRTWDLNASDNYNFEKGGYTYGNAYANSKLANVYMANALERRYAHMGLHGISLHPGAMSTALPRDKDPNFLDYALGEIGELFKSLEQGAATTVVAAIGKEWENRGGKYMEDCEEAKRGKDDRYIFGAGYVQQTYNPDNEERLWKDSLKIVGMDDGTQ